MRRRQLPRWAKIHSYLSAGIQRRLQRLGAGREAAAQRSTFLAEASTLLASSLDMQATLVRLAEYSVRSFADWCTIALVDEKGKIERAAARHRDPGMTERVLEYASRHPEASVFPDALNVIRSGQSVLRTAASEADYAHCGGGGARIELLKLLKARSCMIVPLKIRERTIGSIVFISSRQGDCFEDEDLKLAEELGRRAGIALENAELYRKAQDAIRLRDEFLSIASHELKTPLTSLKLQCETNARLLRGLACESLPEERIARSIRITNEQIDRIAALIEDMLNIARIQGGRLSVHPRRADLAELVRETCDRLEPQLTKAKCPLRLELPESLDAEFDAFRIEQVLTNYLSNVAKHAPGAPVEVKLERTENFVRLSVRDGGPGIPENVTGRLFQRYERLNLRSGVGLGLGLYISRHIVELHGGRVWAANHAEGGAVFGFELPRA